MTTALDPNPVTYYKRYRMELDLLAPLAPLPALPTGFTWLAWEERLLEKHALAKYQCFVDELDGVIFPNLSNRDGCLRLMRDIATRPGFRPEATWLIADGDTCVATIQGVSDRAGTGCIQNVGVIPAYRGRGLGLAIVLQALHGFRGFGLARATLEVTAQNENAVQLYRQIGFRFRKTLYKMVEPTIYRFEPEWTL